MVRIADFLLATGRSPGRKTNPHRLLLEADGWRVRQKRLETGAQDGEKLDPGPAAILDQWERGSAVIRFIPNVLALREESQRMRHCVDRYVEEAKSGRFQFFHGEVEGERGTLCLGFHGGNQVSLQAKGVRNAELSERAWIAINQWLGDLSAAMTPVDHQREAVLVAPHMDLQQRLPFQDEGEEFEPPRRSSQATVVVADRGSLLVALEHHELLGRAPIIVGKRLGSRPATHSEGLLEQGVPVVEHPYLAKALFALEVGEEIPVNLYGPVAEVMAEIYKRTTRMNE